MRLKKAGGAAVKGAAALLLLQPLSPGPASASEVAGPGDPRAGEVNPTSFRPT